MSKESALVNVFQLTDKTELQGDDYRKITSRQSDYKDPKSRFILTIRVDELSRVSVDEATLANWVNFFNDVIGDNSREGRLDVICRPGLYQLSFRFAIGEGKIDWLDVRVVENGLRLPEPPCFQITCGDSSVPAYLFIDNKYTTVDTSRLQVDNEYYKSKSEDSPQGQGIASVFKTYKYSFELKDSPFLERIIRNQKIKNARAAIMSRNMSHNIGSHVLSHLGNDLSRESFADSDSSIRLGVSHFVSYLQERQDFIAAVANEDIGTITFENFKDAIYDFLNPEYVHKRHTNTKKRQNVLLHYIALSEGFQRPFLDSDVKAECDHNLRILFGNFDGENVQDAQESFEKMRGLNFAMPLLGRQAFCSILENILRNAAKHDNEHFERDLTLTINSYDSNSGSFPEDQGFAGNLGLSDVINKFYKDCDGGGDFYYLTLTINNNYNIDKDKRKALLSKLRYSSISPYFDKNGSFIETDKGFKEIRICASWLRGAPEDDIGCFPKDTETDKVDSEWDTTSLKEPPLVFVRYTDKCELQYIICLRKIKEVAYVTNDESRTKGLETTDTYWRYFSERDYVEKATAASYRYTVVADGVNYDFIRSHCGCYCFKESEVGDITLFWKNEDKRRQYVLDLLKKVSLYEDGDQISVDDSRGTTISPDARDRIITTEVARFNYIEHYNPENDNEVFDSVEAISAKNSTDRLVRHNNNDGMLELSWFYQHLRALKSKVVIIDERLFNVIRGDDGRILALLNKRVYICSIEIRDKSNIFLHYYIRNPEERQKPIEEKCLLKSDKDRLFAFQDDCKGDLISVHQGIIDKLYVVSDINGADARREMIKKLYNSFSRDPKILNDNKDGMFLCGLSIHSGRARPPKEQMPLNLPFIPFSSITKATWDCKFSLVELLSSARYL